MTPLGTLVSNWLASGPGPFYGASEDEALRLAYEASAVKKRGVTQIDFNGELARSGYRPVHRGITNVYALCLPEGSKGL